MGVRVDVSVRLLERLILHAFHSIHSSKQTGSLVHLLVCYCSPGQLVLTSLLPGLGTAQLRPLNIPEISVEQGRGSVLQDDCQEATTKRNPSLPLSWFLHMVLVVLDLHVSTVESYGTSYAAGSIHIMFIGRKLD
ncbi:hypothetical protein XENOCAPTIV_013035 [Xenoophorus captivus]|uniref:Uncharacterized protein n=1 Tax=Xenoophorus captivus TaxID=1517983 RepID=A0ABV0Q3P9_9TELE